MTIGEKIKELRKQQNVTQEKLAEYLNISYQAVSKWENGSAMPDISLVVPIANFFGVSTDTLFDMNAQAENDETDEIYRINRELSNKGLVRERLEHMRKAIEKYPRNYSFLSLYASHLQGTSCDNAFDGDPKVKEYLNEAVSICLRILEDCNDESIRSGMLQTLVFAYKEIGEDEKAVEYANKAANIYCSREILLHHVYKGEEKKKQLQENISEFLDLLTSDIHYMHFNCEDDKLFTQETALKIYQAVFYDENYLFYHCRIANIYKALAAIYADKKDAEKTLEYLDLAKKHAVLYDNLPDIKQNYTGIFLNMKEFNR